ncbi:MAG: zf-HC2 domain-containing protein [Desulfobacterales bacterium]|nr:zf-HC2 domain-containing protein [Desulfobacterales bacterium]
MINHWMFRCKDVSQKVSLSMDAPLPWHQRLAVEVHLLMCRYCARFSRQLQLLRQCSQQVDTDSPESAPAAGLSSECKKRIKKAMHACD